eukprot:TRINITY_DN62596_c0_g1_i1.p1 TRINITY_DN62596_c0_g1~~TRINITY_DN62596_c0_g1_i1.p1  ORF type:complete len:752 (+),score=110.37 TRINITY_DN62596_c0_g1_i1:83-2338(+)
MPEHRPITFEDLHFEREKYRKSVDVSKIQLDNMVIACLRGLAMDSVEQAKSGHPGTPMAMAPVAYTLWARLLRYDPTNPIWPNRDRFVLSMGHASTLLYGLLHLAGVQDLDEHGNVIEGEYAVPLDSMKHFRQLNSRCPGHPEYLWTPGVEATTGPLGQGTASSVGMAIASKWLGATFNRPGFDLFDYDTYALAGDGCLMEGVSSEAASLAGHLKLDNLCWIWDNNHITIEGNTSWAISEEVGTRFIAYGWNVVRVGDANDVESLTRAFRGFRREKERPTLLIVDSYIAWGAPTKQGHFTAHGTPLGADEVSGAKEIYGWPNEKFLVPGQAVDHIRRQMASRGGEQRVAWEALLARYGETFPEEAVMLKSFLSGTLPDGWDRFCKEFPADAKGLATRASSGECLNMVARGVPWLVGGSADMGTSCHTTLKFDEAHDFMPPGSEWGTYAGRNLHFGIREHAMGSIMNGMALSKLRPFGSTFLSFCDYMAPPTRMAAIMELPSIFIFTHDSACVGEDGPTHQPVEHLCVLRGTPGLSVFRPCDANETLAMWKHIMPLRDEPVVVILSRQDLPTLDRNTYASAAGLTKGAYIIAGPSAEESASVELILMATGSEVALMLKAHEKLTAEGVKVRSISMPCMELFEQQPQAYVDSMLPRTCRARVSIEAGRQSCWDAWIGLDGEHIGIMTSGDTAPTTSLPHEFVFPVEMVLEAAHRVLRGKQPTLHEDDNIIRSFKRRRTLAVSSVREDAKEIPA